jgi:alanyl-tRNA synthetase
VVRRGLDRLAALDTGPGFEVTGEDAFTLFATHGMPVDLIRDFAAERGGSLDERRFADLFAEHRELSRGTERGGLGGSPLRASTAAEPGGGPGRDARAGAGPEAFAALNLPPTRFLGHHDLTATGEVIALAGPHGLADTLTAGDSGLAVFDQTPFYAEGGGQVGDTGQVTGRPVTGRPVTGRPVTGRPVTGRPAMAGSSTSRPSTGPGGSARVTDTQGTDGHYVHAIEVTVGTLSVGDTVELAVDAARRRSIMRNHSATHLLHAALRQVLGDHLRQAGSLVAPDRLRFDFLHPQALSDDETERVERLVNAQVLENAERTTAVKLYQNAIREGAIAFFGDKYGDDVRVVSFGNFSTELCGGTHVHGTAEVGLFLIVSEGSIGSGVRRIEAVTGEAAVQRALERDRLLRGLAGRLRVPVDQLPLRVEALTARSRLRSAGLDASSLATAVRVTPAGHRVVVVDDSGIAVPDLPSQARQLADELDAVAVLLLPDSQGGSLRVGVSVPGALASQLPATAVLDQVLAVTGGRGGGSATFAQGGGAIPDDIPGVVSRVREVLDTSGPWPAVGS